MVTPFLMNKEHAYQRPGLMIVLMALLLALPIAFAWGQDDVGLGSRPIAFPGAEGFGRYATGGRGGQVIFVTNLKDAGPGSLRAALETTGARTVLFKLSGTIDLQSPLRIEHGDLTIAGQSAPGDGICLRNYPLLIAADNVIIRFLRFRLGDQHGQETDALSCRFQKNIMIDHCSMSWSVDECVSLYENEYTSLQWCIISESLNNSVHSKGRHGYGGIWGGRYASFHHNLLAHHQSRNPRLGERAKGDFALTDLVDLRNNVIYNWGYNTCYGGEAMNVNIVNCYYKPGPASSHRGRIVSIDKSMRSGTAIYDRWGRFYIAGNVVEGAPEVNQDNWKHGVLNQFSDRYEPLSIAAQKELQLENPHPIDGNTYTHDAAQAYELVLANAGASLARDVVDQRVVDNVRAGNFSYPGSKGGDNGIIDSQEDVGGWPELKSSTSLPDTSGDGIPDVWKLQHGLDPELFQANSHELHPQYTNLELYLNSLVAELMPTQ